MKAAHSEIHSCRNLIFFHLFTFLSWNEYLSGLLSTKKVYYSIAPSGNLPNLLNRFRCYNRVLGIILPSGLAWKHRANSAAALQAYNIHCILVLMSGLLLLQKIPTSTPGLFSVWQLTWQSYFASETVVKLWHDHWSPACLIILSIR